MLIGNYAVGQEMIGCAHTPISILVPPDFEPGAPGIYFPGVFFCTGHTVSMRDATTPRMYRLSYLHIHGVVGGQRLFERKE